MFQKAETEVESVLGFLMSSLKKTHPFLFHRLLNIPLCLKSSSLHIDGIYHELHR